jgi:hypothetical protein
MAMDDEVADLRQRLRLLEDEREIARLVCHYGPLVDSNSREEAAELWTEDGTYANDIGSWTGRAEIAGILAGQIHQDLIRGGAAHFLSVPYIVVDGDRAVATNYGLVFRRAGEGFDIFRLISIRWECERTEEGWRVRYRLNQLLDGSALGRQILAASEDLEHLDPRVSAKS